MPPSHLRSLTGLRFIAAMEVIVFHCTRWELWPVPPFVRNVAGAGYVAVSLFFVLSGFILTYVHAGPNAKPLDKRDFYRSRFARIYPAYAFALALIAPLFAGHTIRTEGIRMLAKSAVAVVLLLQAYVPSLAMAWNPPAWSLSAEAFFYAVFPFVAPRLVRCRRGTALFVGVGCYALCLAIPLLYLYVAPDAPVPPTKDSYTFWLSALRYNPVVRLPEFLIGIIAGRLFIDSAGRNWGAGAGWLSVAAGLAVATTLTMSPSIPYPILHNGLLVPVFALLIVTLATERGPLAALLSTRPMVALGEASYSLYILHVPLMILWRKGLGHVAHGRLIGAPASTAAFLVTAVVASLLCHRYIERPLQKATLSMLRRRPAHVI
jgi:peptidoglycan/LPS O-acetylase OafA/YrhL